MTLPSILEEERDGCNVITLHKKRQKSTQWKSHWEHCNLSLNLGHSILNQALCSFVKIGQIGALHAVTQDIQKSWLEVQHKKKCLKNMESQMLRFECVEQELVFGKCWKQMASRAGKEAFQWGFVGAVYSGMTYGIQEVRGVCDWKNTLVGGAITGAALSLTQGKTSMDHLVKAAITGGAVAMAVEILTKNSLDR
ncbi:unnamed protein product [Calypogeia fissa]